MKILGIIGLIILIAIVLFFFILGMASLEMMILIANAPKETENDNNITE